MLPRLLCWMKFGRGERNYISIYFVFIYQQFIHVRLFALVCTYVTNYMNPQIISLILTYIWISLTFNTNSLTSHLHLLSYPYFHTSLFIIFFLSLSSTPTFLLSFLPSLFPHLLQKFFIPRQRDPTVNREQFFAHHPSLGWQMDTQHPSGRNTRPSLSSRGLARWRESRWWWR